MKIRILKGAKFRPWLRHCRTLGHDWQATSAQCGDQTLYRCDTCTKEKWGRRWALEFFPPW